jgi:hypothetical protein
VRSAARSGRRAAPSQVAWSAIFPPSIRDYEWLSSYALSAEAAAVTAEIEE